MKHIVIWIMYHEKDVEKNRWFIDSFIEKCSLYDIHMQLVTVEQFLQSFEKTHHALPDAVVARMINPAVSKLLEEAGVRVFNSYRVSNICNNKAACLRHVNALGVRHIPALAISYTKKDGIQIEFIYDDDGDFWYDTIGNDGCIHLEYVCGDGGFTYEDIYGKGSLRAKAVSGASDGSKSGCDDSGFSELCPCASFADKYVIKFVTGHGGREVMLLSEYLKRYGCLFKNHDTLPKAQEQAAADYYSDKFVLQPLIECDGRDLRVYIVGGKIIGSVIRTAREGFKSNFSLGGTAEQYTLNRKQKRIVKKITKSLSIDYGGLDFLVCGEDDKLLFNEIEDVVGARMLDECSDIDYIGCYAKHIHSCLTADR